LGQLPTGLATGELQMAGSSLQLSPGEMGEEPTELQTAPPGERAHERALAGVGAGTQASRTTGPPQLRQRETLEYLV